VHDPILDHYQPRTEIGHKLLALRRVYLESGGKLMTWDEIDEEVRRRRGGLSDGGGPDRLAAATIMTDA